MEDQIYKEIYKGLTIKIIPDEHAEGPNDWGNTDVFLVGYHRNFWVEAPKHADKYNTDKEGKRKYFPMFSKDELIAYLNKDYENCNRELFKQYHILPLEAYIHSGVRLALRHEGNFPDRQWDVSHVGAVLIEKKEARTKDKARKLALSVIAEWNDYLSGNVWGYVTKDADGEELDSCWGFYGDYEENALPEARRSARGFVKERIKHIREGRSLVKGFTS